jgi:anaerobic magnesium-protoporphyrin IX monomethyl ester cyclase
MSEQGCPVVLVRIDRAAVRHTRHPRHLFPALDLKYVQSGLAVRHGIRAALVDGWLQPFDASRCADEALAMRPRIAVLKGVSWCLEETIETARILRRAGVITIAVGQAVQHAAVQTPPGWHEAFDHVLAGEPEAALPEFVAALLANVSPVLAVAPSGLSLVHHPDQLPDPDCSSQELADYPFPFPLRGGTPARWAYLLTAWGCPRPCRHCTNIVRKSVGRPLRTRSIERVLDEVARLADAGAEALAFEDDSLFVHRKRFLELADGLVRRGLTLPWLANARPDELDGETVAAARLAGARLVKVGIDSGSPRMIEAIGKSSDGAAWPAASGDAIRLLDDNGIGSVALFVVGLPGETSSDARLSFDLARQLPADYLQVQLYRPYPDVGLWPDLPPQQRVAAGEYHYGEMLTQCSAMSDAEIAAWPRRFYRAFYLRPTFVFRHLRLSWRHYLPGGRPGNALASLGYLVRGG